jgi:exopolysaccharide biosynthesis WecB/TagA/CpsF family protein
MSSKDRKVRHFTGIAVRTTGSDGAIAEVLDAIYNRTPNLFSFCNAATINHAHSSPEFGQVLNRAVLFNDGIGLDLASMLLYGSFFPDNLNGTDFIPQLLQAIDRPVSLYLVGGLPGVAEGAADKIRSYNPHISVVGTHHGYFHFAETPQISAEIAKVAPDLVMVGMGQPRQEMWSDTVRADIGVPFLCVGAFMDFASGRMPRAPKLVRMMRVEWVYRLVLEPRRLFGRYIGGAVPYFFRILAQRFGMGGGR